MPAPESNAVQVTNSEFLRTLAQGAPNGTSLWVTSFSGSPDLTDVHSWAGRPYMPVQMAAAVDAWTAENTYFAVGALAATADGELRRRKANFVRLLVLVVDDVLLEDIQGSVSYVLETSPAKTQVGIFLDGNDPDAANMPLVDKLVTTMAEKGLLKGDVSGNNAVRYVRLPVGQNQKPRESGAWTHRMLRWAPTTRMSLADAAGAFGVDLDALRSAAASLTTTGMAGLQDERLRVLISNVVRGENLHDSVNQIAASLVATGMPGGAVVNTLRGLMDASLALKDERWLARYQDIPRSVTTAQEKFGNPTIVFIPRTNVVDGLPLVFAENITADSVKLDQLVEDTLTQGGLSVMYGESNSGKSFMACDMACAIGAGQMWLGKRTVAGAVLYVAGEGSESMKLRVLAWRQHRAMDTKVAIVPVAINLLEKHADVQRIVDACKVVNDRYSLPVALVVIDTLARAFGGGNENSSEDMGAVIAHADLLREATKAHVLFVHHSGKDQAKGSRGHSSLKAATDTEIEVTGDEATKLHTAEITKQRDLSTRGDKVTGKFRVLRMGTDQWGKPVTTCVVEPTDEKQPAPSKKQKGGELRMTVVTVLSMAPNRTMKRAALVKALTESGFTSSPIYRVFSELAREGVTTEVMHNIHLNNMPTGET